MPDSRDTFVGREPETAALSAALDDVFDGRGSMLMLSGEPGIGKTRLAEELASAAEDREALVAWGYCHEYAGAPPYWPWIQLLRGIAPVADPAGDGVRDPISAMAGLSPEIESNPSSLTSDAARFKMFDSIRSFFLSAAESRTLVLIIDDLQHADDASVQLLEFMLNELGRSRILVLATCSDAAPGGEGAAPSLPGLSRHRSFRRLRLNGLVEADVLAILAATTGRDLPAEAVQAVLARTEGNSFFVAEIAREMSAAPIAPCGGWTDFSVPDGIRDAIERRLSVLSTDTRDTLLSAAILGREFAFAEVSAVHQDVSEEALAGRLEEALAARVLAAGTEGMDRYRFTHGLIRETLAEGLSPRRRVRLHARAAQALEQLYRDRPDGHVEALAMHFTRAEPATGPLPALKYSIKAGERALASYAFENALPHFERALELAENPGVDPAVTAAAQMGAGRTQAALRNVQAAIENLGAAFDHYIDVEDRDHIAAVARQQFVGNEGMAAMIPIMERALAHLDPEGIDAAMILALHGRAVGTLEDDYRTAMASLAKSLEIARRNKDTTLEFRTHALAANVNAFHLHFDRMREHARAALQVGGRVEAPLEEAQLHILAVIDPALVGDRPAERRRIELGVAAATRSGDRERLSSVHFFSLWLAMNRGEWEAAREAAGRALEAWPDDPRVLGLRAVMEYELGNDEAAGQDLGRVHDLRSDPFVHTLADHACRGFEPHISRITGSPVFIDSAAEAARATLASGSPSPSNRLDAARALGWAAVIGGDREAAQQLYSTLTDMAHIGWGYGGVTSVPEVAANLARTVGDAEGATKHFELAISQCREAAFPRPLAWVCADYAEYLVERGTGEAAHTTVLLDEAAAITAELGMKPLAARVESIQGRAVASGGAATYPDGLSRREVEVLQLIAVGMSNQQIADRLIISRYTVVRHISNIFGKIGAANRAEAATYTHRHGLLAHNTEN